METQDWYSVNEFAPNSYQITEGGRFNMLLLVGDEKAVAIDGGIGIGNLRKLYESITDKPIDFILTHTHWDHVGAASQWEKVGVHPVGETLLANDLSKLEQGFLNMWKKNGKHLPRVVRRGGLHHQARHVRLDARRGRYLRPGQQEVPRV